MNGIQEKKTSAGARDAKASIGTEKKRLTQERLTELIEYDPQTGKMVWRRSSHGVLAGRHVGWETNGYFACQVDTKTYLCHRLAWLYVYGYMPENGLDHINRCGTDNRIKNLREVSSQCNVRNSGTRKDNASGVRGVRWDKDNEKWRASITDNRKRIHLGYYYHKDNAVCARLSAEQCLDWSECDSRSPAYLYVKNMVSTSPKTVPRHGHCGGMRQ